MVKLMLKSDFDPSELDSGDLNLGYKEVTLLFNAGPFIGGGDCIIVEADGRVGSINSNDLIHDMKAYQMSKI